MKLTKAACWEESCDFCECQEGTHYCLLNGVVIKNMDTVTCDDWEARKERDNERS